MPYESEWIVQSSGCQGYVRKERLNCPFRAGPQMCIGMRFAVMGYRIAVARLLKRFNIKSCPETRIPCPTKVIGLFSPLDIKVMLEKRN